MKRKIVKERVAKRIFDIVVSFLLLVLLSPFLVLIALLLKVEGLFDPSFKGPVFYKEIRISRGKPFQIYKFRTVTSKNLKMLKNGDRSITEFTSKRDKLKYLTPVGAFLAQRYLDELPQLFNALKGNMSLVGPRPHIPHHYEKDLKDGVVSAKYIKAGVMGIVQASKGNPKMRKVLARMASKRATTDKAMVFIDRLYFQKYLRSSAVEMLFYDLDIIFRCLRVVLEAKGI